MIDLIIEGFLEVKTGLADLRLNIDDGVMLLRHNGQLGFNFRSALIPVDIHLG
ncbi:hypothetical protein D3C85_1470690 [compost metagenome]